jgi:hypothetical protein
MNFPPLPTSGPLISTIQTLLPNPNEGVILILGGKSLKKQLLLSGYKIDYNINLKSFYEVAISIDNLPKKRDAALDHLKKLSQCVKPNGTVYLCEQSNPLEGKRGIVTKFLSVMGFLHHPETITNLFMSCGFINVKQIWPQGFRSMLITWGNPHRLANKAFHLE